MADFSASANCLAAAYVSFVTQETTKLTAKVASIVASFTDPLEALANTNTQQLINDVSDLTSGDVAGKLASMGAAIIVNKVKRELDLILQDIIQHNPAVGDAIQRITNITEAVYGIVSLAVMLRREAPFSAIQYLRDELLTILDAKEQTLNQLKQHIIQLNNVMMSCANNPAITAALLAEAFAKVSVDLGNAVNYLLSLEVSLGKSPSVFSDKDYNSAVSELTKAYGLVSPATDKNLLDVGTALASAGIGVEYLTDAQIKLASYSTVPIALLIDCELAAIDTATTKINFYLDQITNAVPDYEASVESASMKSFRIKLVAQIRMRIQSLKSDIDSALTKESLDSMALHALAWSSRLSSINTMMPKVKNEILTSIPDNSRYNAMSDEVDAMVDAIDNINGTNVQAGRENTTALKSQISTLAAQAKNIMSLMGSNKITTYDTESFRTLVNDVTKSGNAAIQDSLSTVSKLKSALALFKTSPGNDQKLDQLISLLELLGMDRARDLLKIGKFTDFLNTTIDDASYIGLAIKCLIKVEGSLEDTATAMTITKIREALEGKRISQLSAAFDIIDSGKNAAILEIKNYLQQGQDSLQAVNRIITELQNLASKAGQTISALSEAAEGVGAAIGNIATNPGGQLNSTLSYLDVNGLQGGCLNQVKF